MKRILTIGVILLFIGSISSSTGFDVREQSNFPTYNGNIDSIPTFSHEPPKEEWNRTFGGKKYDVGESVRQTSDGGYIVAGRTNSYSSNGCNAWLVKTDARGNELWNRTFGGGSWDSGNSVQQTSDGGYIVAGTTYSYGPGSDDVWLIKTDANGSMQWNEIFGGKKYDVGKSVQQTSDGGYVIVGTTNSYSSRYGVWLIKTDNKGSEQWNKTFGGKNSAWGFSVDQTTDGGYIIQGNIHKYPSWEDYIWLIKTDDLGNELWNKTFGGTEIDYAESVQQTSDGGYVIAGYTGSYGSNGSRYWSMWLIKTDANGSELCNKTFGRTSMDIGESVQQTFDGGYIIAGTTGQYSSDVWLVRTDSIGNELWNKTIGRSLWDNGTSVQQTADGGYIIAGWTSTSGYYKYDMWLIKIYPENSIVYVDDDFNESTPGWNITYFDNIQDGINAVNVSGTVYVYSGTYYENVVVDKSMNLIGEDKDTTVINVSSGDCITVNSDWVNISNFTIKFDGNCGIRLSNSNNTTISDNILLLEYGNWGIVISHSNSVVIKRNILSGDYYAIYASYSNYNKIIGNFISDDCNAGMTFWNSKDNIIKDNNISNCIWGGINVTESGNFVISGNTISNIQRTGGLNLRYQNNSIITSNILFDNGIGIFMKSSNNNNTIIGNIISKNDVGIWTTSYITSYNNSIYHNNFINNTQNAYDRDGNDNTWDNGYPSGGNYWDDYTGKDNNWDRIGDTPYSIPGDNSSDRYPLMEPYGSEPSPIVGTFGPLCPLLDIAEINILDGNESQIKKIERILNNRILQFIIPFKTINVTGLNFTISYNRDIPSLWIFYKRLWYTTIIDENRDITFYNNSHTVTVERLEGTFYFYRGQFFSLFPPHFLFAGYCENVTIELHKEDRI